MNDEIHLPDFVIKSARADLVRSTITITVEGRLNETAMAARPRLVKFALNDILVDVDITPYQMPLPSSEPEPPT